MGSLVLRGTVKMIRTALACAQTAQDPGECNQARQTASIISRSPGSKPGLFVSFLVTGEN